MKPDIRSSFPILFSHLDSQVFSQILLNYVLGKLVELKLSSKVGIPGVKSSLLEEFGIHLLTYDLPGFGESDPDPKRDLESSAMDILHLAYAVNVTEKLWVLGYSEGSKHAFAALHYIPDRIAGNSTASL